MKKYLLYFLVSCFISSCGEINLWPTEDSHHPTPSRESDLQLELLDGSVYENVFHYTVNGFFYTKNSKSTDTTYFCFSNFNRIEKWCIPSKLKGLSFYSYIFDSTAYLYSYADIDAAVINRLCDSEGCHIIDSLESINYRYRDSYDLNFGKDISLYSYFDTVIVSEELYVPRKHKELFRYIINNYKLFDIKALNSNRIRFGYVTIPTGSVFEQTYLRNSNLTIGYDILDRNGKFIESKKWTMNIDSTKPAELIRFSFTEGDQNIPMILDENHVVFIPNWTDSQKWLVLIDSMGMDKYSTSTATCWQGLCTYRGDRSFQFRYPQ